ncbi:MAG: ATP-dependent Clp protease ATP-binding subunit [Patescibacteria group bacterium]
MLFTKPAPHNLLVCDTCKGAGYVGFRKCAKCRGMSIGKLSGNEFLYFGEPLTRYHINVRKAGRILGGFRIIGALVFGIGLMGFFIWITYRRGLLDNIITLSFWDEPENSTQAFFWLSIISFSYLWYRLILRRTPQETIPYRDFEAKEKEQTAEFGQLQTWTEARKLSRKKRRDIALVFTPEARKVIEEAYRVAIAQKAEFVDPFHLFYALLSAVKIGNIFVRFGISIQLVKAHISKLFENKQSGHEPIINNDMMEILFGAYDKATLEKQEYVEITDLLYAAVRQSEALQEILYDLKIDQQKLANVIEWIRIRERLRRQYFAIRKAGSRRSKYGLDRAMTAVATPYLNSFSQDVTMAAKYGHLAPIVARDKEIDEIFRIIEGGRQSVLLVGDRGVGKTSIIEGIAERMIEDAVPDILKDKRLVQLSTSALLAGTTVSGAQERLLRIMNEVSRAKNIILFINNLHDLVGAGGEGGGLDVSETLAEYLGPGRFFTFATTTVEGYNKFIINTQIGKVFSRVDIREMDQNQAIQALESKVGGIEYKQKVFFSYDALEKSVALAGRFLQDSRLPESAIEIMSESASLVRSNKGENNLVTAEDAAAVVGEKTGIPTASISEDESAKLLRLEEEMHKMVIGQEEAVNLVANALRRARAEVRSQKRPIANFLFLGPTGVGKTELAKTIAKVYFGGEDKMVRIDMSEYQDQVSIYRLIGQPGKKGTGILTEAVRQKPFSLVLLDEMEKADPNVLNLFLQVFDDGRLTDSMGRLIDFTNTIIIATSNAATAYVQEQIAKGAALEEIRQALIRVKLKQYYKPEFLNRFDGIVLFKSLEREEIKQVASLMLKRVAKDLEQRGVELRVEEAALESLAEIGFDPQFGARPMRRAIQDKVENKLAELILSNKLKRRDVVVLGEGAEIRVESS